MTVILCEEIFEESIWSQKLYISLKNELKKRRIPYSKTLEPKSISNGDTVYIIGSSYKWINNSLSICNSLNIIPVILCNHSADTLSGKYHSVTTDVNECMKHIISSANITNPAQIALYGTNVNSISDMSREKSYLKLTNNASGVFENHGSLDDCFNSFFPYVSEFETIICVNNYVAISLVKNLSKNCPSELERLKIISCSSSKLSSHFSKYITFIETNFECYGSAALEIAKISSANPYISEINITINWDAYGVPLPKFTSNESEPVQLDKFYEDTEIQNFLKLDTLLCLCDKLDIKIIKLLMNGHSYDEVSDRLFMAKETVKYRSKKYFRICKVNTKSEFIKFIKEFHQFFEEDNL